MLLKLKEACKILSISPQTARKKIKSGQWPFYLVGQKAVHLDPEEIIALTKMQANHNGDTKT